MQLNPVDSNNKTLSMPCCRELHYHLQINNSKENVRKMLPDSVFFFLSPYKSLHYALGISADYHFYLSQN